MKPEPNSISRPIKIFRVQRVSDKVHGIFTSDAEHLAAKLGAPSPRLFPVELLVDKQVTRVLVGG